KVGSPRRFERRRVDRALKLGARRGRPRLRNGGGVQVSRSSRAVERGRSRQCRKVLSPRLAHYCASGHEVFEGYFDVLVVDVQLFFESIKLGIVEDLPPLAAEHGIRRL